MKRVILVTGSWCVACKPMKAFWNQLSFKDAAFEILDVELDADFLVDKNICSLPTVLYMEDNEVIAHTTSAQSRTHVIEICQDIWD